ncbi:MAG: hypothetical protein NTX22_08915 [Ignavibacteriales bacterium]|nr:hypothetical protein [Ignavibacteriales bacterium]
MRKFISLTKILLKNSWSTFGSGKKPNKKNILYLILIVISVLPMVIGIGTSTATMYDLFFPIHQEGVLLATGFTSISVLILVFGIFYVINIFYFAQDIDKLLPLPLRPAQIISAKFCVTLIYEYLTVAMFLLPLIIAFGIKSSGGLLYYLHSFLLLLSVPIIPLIIAAVIVMFIMQFSNLTKKKDQFRIVAAIIGIGLVLILNYFITNYLNVSDHPEKALNLLTSGNNTFADIVAKIFPTVKMATKTLLYCSSTEGFLSLVSFFAINSIFVIAFLFIGESMYLKGAVGGSEVYSEKKSPKSNQLLKTSLKNSFIKSYTLKEIKILFRTPAFFINCVLVNFMWPILLFIGYSGVDGGGLGGIRSLLEANRSDNIIIAASLLVGLFISASNGITASAVSREGSTFFVNKYLPLAYKNQIIGKLFSGIIISSIGLFLIAVTAGVILKLSFLIILLSIAISFLGILFTSFLGLLLDLNFPKLIWDNEYKPIKQNMNVVINILASTILGVIVVYSAIKIDVGLISEIVIILLLLGILDLFLYNRLMTKGAVLIRELEI